MAHVHADIARFRGPIFDHYFVWVIPSIGLAAAALVMAGWVSFTTMLMLDLALLGYHHVITTYSRFSFDAQSAAQNRLLLVQVPILVLVSVIALATLVGVWSITTIYLHWQWFHYTRQSEGISKAFGFKTGSAQAGNANLNRSLFYLTPITALLALSHRQPKQFLLMDLYTLPVPAELVYAAGAVNAALFLNWLYRQAVAVAAGQMKALHLAYFISHHLIYLLAYVVITDINVGWLAINTWHNLQYISFVWVCNVNQHKDGFNPQRPIISWLSQPRRAVIYVFACVLITRAVYNLIDVALTATVAAALMPVAVIIAYQSINFHHYIVDSVIWKLKKKSVRAVVGISA
jgi:hypothetical protein